MDEFGVTFDEMVKKEKEKAVANLKQQVSSPPSSSTAVVVENVNSSNLHNTEVNTPLQPVTPASGAAVTGKLNSSDLVVNVNPTRVRLSLTTSHSELPISCRIVDGKCLLRWEVFIIRNFCSKFLNIRQSQSYRLMYLSLNLNCYRHI